MKSSQNRTRAAGAALAFVGCYVLLAACSTSPENTTTPPSQLPVTPPNPATAPSVITDVSSINAGQVPKNTRVLVYGQLTTKVTGDDDEWNFDDGTGTIVLDFQNNDVPSPGVNILVLGAVDDDDGRREIDVEAWETEATKPPEPVAPPPKRPDPSPPALEITSVQDILNGQKGEVILAGQLTGLTEDNDCDEYFFTDGNGTLKLDFSSCHVPPLNTPVYILGKVDDDANDIEVDVWEWALQSAGTQ